MTQLGLSIAPDFPILSRQVHGRQLVYLDNAATSQKPQSVIDAISSYYSQHNANVHRGVHQLSDESTQMWHDSRRRIADFFGADDSELIMVRNTTEAINGVVLGWALDHLKPGDVILTAVMEHHSNLVPWQEACARTGAKLEVVSVSADGRIEVTDLRRRLESRPVKLVALNWVSNALGTLNPIAEIVGLVRRHAAPDAVLLLDAAQAAPHLPINFKTSDVDFLAFSGHKMLGPMGSGGLLVKRQLLESGQFRPWLFGGGMIAEVWQHQATYHPEASDRFTAGTPDVASAVGLAAACDYLSSLGWPAIIQHDQDLVAATLEALRQFPQLTIVGPTDPMPGQPLDRVGSVAFVYEGVHAHDVAQVLDSQGVAVRSGHHCTMPLHQHFDWVATTRVSFQVYNHRAELERLAAALWQVKTVFGR